MYTSSAVSPGTGLGIGIHEKHDTYYLTHDGGGFGFSTTMKWYPEHGIGCIVLTNGISEKTPESQSPKIAHEILDGLIADRVVAKVASDAIAPADELIGKDAKLTELPEPGRVHTPTPYKSEWSRYRGTYRFIAKGYKLDSVVRALLALGYCHPAIKLTVVKRNGYLCIGDEELEEHQPGLFFTPSGEALDLRGPVPTWRNIKMDKSPFFWSL
jgi:hypothetical protein